MQVSDFAFLFADGCADFFTSSGSGDRNCDRGIDGVVNPTSLVGIEHVFFRKTSFK